MRRSSRDASPFSTTTKASTPDGAIAAYCGRGRQTTHSSDRPVCLYQYNEQQCIAQKTHTHHWSSGPISSSGP